MEAPGSLPKNELALGDAHAGSVQASDKQWTSSALVDGGVQAKDGYDETTPAKWTSWGWRLQVSHIFVRSWVRLGLLALWAWLI